MHYEGLKQTDKPFGVMRICDYKTGNRKTLQIKLNDDMLDEPVIILSLEDKLIVQRVGMDYTGKTRRLSEASSRWFNTVLTGSLIEQGRYYADEDESTFDKYVFYYEDKDGVLPV